MNLSTYSSGENEVVGVAKWRIIKQSGKGFVNEAELQNSNGYTESPEFLLAVGLLSLSLQLEVN